MYDFSVIIPAHNEENYIGKCLEAAVKASKAAAPDTVQIITVANRCTDKTVDTAMKYGSEICYDDSRCISCVRNTGIAAAKGRIIVTVDADSAMTENSLTEIKQMLSSGKYIGGGTRPVFDRMSAGIFFSSFYVAMKLAPEMFRSKAFLSGGMFWFYKNDFLKIGGFDESLVSLEDLDFAKKLKKLGDSCNKKYGTLKKSYIITSARKFDQFGDWYLIKNRKLTNQIFTGKNKNAADKFYYDAR